MSRELSILMALAGMIGIGAVLINHGDTEGLRSFRAHDTLVETTIFSSSGQSLATCGWDKQVKIWDIGNEQFPAQREVVSMGHDWHVFDVAMTPDDSLLASGGTGGLRVWEADGSGGWKEIADERGVSRRCVAASPDGRTVATGGGDGSVRLWDVESRHETAIPGGAGDEPRAISFTSDSRIVGVATFGGELRLWDLKADGGPRALTFSPRSVQCFGFLPGGRQVAVARFGDAGKDILIWDQVTGSQVLRLSNNATETAAMAISGDGKTLAAADKNRTVRVWDLSTGLLKQTFRHDGGWIQTVSFSRDGRQLAFGGRSGYIFMRSIDSHGQFVETTTPAKPGRDGMS